MNAGISEGIFVMKEIVIYFSVVKFGDDGRDEFLNVLRVDDVNIINTKLIYVNDVDVRIYV